MTMKRIRIDFVGFWPGFEKQDNLISNLLKERYKVEITDNPDFLIVSPFGNPFSYMKYDCVRILFTGEPLTPDFNVFDYAIGFDHLTILDEQGYNRFFRFPLCFYEVDRVKKHLHGMKYDQAREVLQNKKYFCNFIYGHHSAKGEREAILDILQRYKRVESAGSFLNNMPDGKVVPFTEEKVSFLQSCKFTIACESISYPGFVTEKLVDPFCADSVPIYYGNPGIETEFNSEAMINLGSFSSLEEGVARVIQIDQDDDLYLKMLMAPKLVSEDYLDRLYEGLREFLFRIFEQEKEEAYRRLRFYVQKSHEDCLKEYAHFYDSAEYRMFKIIQRVKRKIMK